MHTGKINKGFTLYATGLLFGSHAICKMMIMRCHVSATVKNNVKYMLCHNPLLYFFLVMGIYMDL
jgi:hypothetical protein